MSASPLILALPSKGRLLDQSKDFLAGAGLSLKQERGARDYSPRLAGIDGVEVRLRSAADIVRELAAGSVHLGVTGLDLLHETLGGEAPGAAWTDEEARPVPPAKVLAKLGFGGADVVIAFPAAWVDVFDMADLADVAARFRLAHHRPMRVATKYLALTRRFLDHHGVADYVIVDSAGATEAAPASGSAEFIVDITSTGKTLVENGLTTIAGGTILKSEAVLAASAAAGWSTDVADRAAGLLARLGGAAKPVVPAYGEALAALVR